MTVPKIACDGLHDAIGEPGSDRCQRIFAQIPGCDTRALGHQQFHQRAADAPGSTGDNEGAPLVNREEAGLRSCRQRTMRRCNPVFSHGRILSDRQDEIAATVGSPRSSAKNQPEKMFETNSCRTGS